MDRIAPDYVMSLVDSEAERCWNEVPAHTVLDKSFFISWFRTAVLWTLEIESGQEREELLRELTDNL